MNLGKTALYALLGGAAEVSYGIWYEEPKWIYIGLVFWVVAVALAIAKIYKD